MITKKSHVLLGYKSISLNMNIVSKISEQHTIK